MPNRCIAAGCDNTPVSSSDWEKAVTLFSFPKDCAMLNKWIANVTLTRPSNKLTSKSKLCSKHFDDNALENEDPYKE
jgi:hypothetical protein